MANSTGSPGGIKKDTKFKDVEGYIHGVSELRMPHSGRGYFDFKIQEKEENRRVVCFNPDKRDEIVDKQHNKSPVRLVNVSPQKRKYEPDSTEYKLNTYSKVMATRNLAFPWKGMPGAENDVSVREIFNSSTIGDIVLLKAKVVWKGDIQTVYSSAMKKELSKCDIVVADSTGAISATVWEKMIPVISNEKSYAFSNLRVSFFNRKYLNATKDCVANVCEDVPLSVESSTATEQLKPKKKEIEDVNGSILAVNVSKCYLCINCKKRIADDAVDDSQFVECSSACNLNMMKRNMNSTVSGSVVIIDEDGQNVGRFHCPGAVLNAMFTSISKTENYNIEETNVAQLSRKMITETLLLINKVSFKISKGNNVIESMEVSK